MENESFIDRLTDNASPESEGAGASPHEKSRRSREWLLESGGQLTLDIYQTESDIVIKSTIAGVKPEDLDVTITNDMLTIKGVRFRDEEVKAEDYYYQECYWGPFSRSVILPADVDADRIKASLTNGILTVRLPKSEKIKTKKISINTD